MAAKKQIFNWVVDAGIWAGFLLAFFLNVTGLDVHQWLGIFLGAFALFHLFLHFGWVKAVTTRFFTKTSWRNRLYYLLDAGLLWGFATIMVTGVVISSWLGLVLPDYGAWRSVHVAASVTTLLAVVVKLGLHWRWIVSTLVKALTPAEPAPRLVPAPALQTVRTGRTVSRRQFLVMMGVVGAGAALGLGNLAAAKNVVQAQAINQTAGTGSNPTAAVTSQSAAASSSTTAAAALVCTQSCPRGKHCSFPGSCGRYTDSNKNGRCDLGECS